MISRLALLALSGLLAMPLDGAAQENSRTPKVILIGIDGVRPDVLRSVPTPNLDSLIRTGAYSDRAQTGLPTISGPGWASMLTGVWKEKHGILSNDFPFPDNGLDRYPDFLTRIERTRPQLRTFAVADWPPLIEPQTSEERGTAGPVLGQAIDARVSYDGGRLGWGAADELSVAAAEAELLNNDPDAMFVYLGNPDEVSHHTGSIEDEYMAAIARADRQVGRLVAAIRARPNYEQEDWLILVSTDHGRTTDGGHGGDTPEERTIFFLANGPRIRPGSIDTPPNIVDVAATALAYLGIGPDPTWGLDGRPVANLER
ncbi:MAG TPA: alkaline phosphatase family protein [Longimicrobiaceae bacterium]